MQHNFEDSIYAKISRGEAALKSDIVRANFSLYSNRNARDRYISLSIVFLIMPAVLLVLYQFVMWLWLGTEEKEKKGRRS